MTVYVIEDVEAKELANNTIQLYKRTDISPDLTTLTSLTFPSYDNKKCYNFLQLSILDSATVICELVTVFSQVSNRDPIQ